MALQVRIQKRFNGNGRMGCETNGVHPERAINQPARILHINT